MRLSEHQGCWATWGQGYLTLTAWALMMPAPCSSSLLDLEFPSSTVPRHRAIRVQDNLSEPGSPEHENPGKGFLDAGHLGIGRPSYRAT